MQCGRILLLPMLVLGVTGSTQLFAGVIDTGTFNYSPTGQVSNPGLCGSYNQDNFSGTVSDVNGLDNATLTFSICDTPDTLTGGEFNVEVDAGDQLSGVVSGEDTGYSQAPGSFTESYSGTFTVTDATGLFDGEDGFSAYFTATDTVNTNTLTGTGSFVVSTPEPGTIALTGLGIAAAAALLRRRRRG